MVPEGSKLDSEGRSAANRWGHMSRQLDFDEAVPVDRGDHEPALIVDIDGFAGPLGPAAGAGAAPEGGPAQDLGAGAGRTISRIHRAGAAVSPRIGRRLSRHGGVARFPEVAPAAARAGQGRGTFRPGTGQRTGVPAAKARTIREASRRLVERTRLGRDVFARGMPEPVVVTKTPEWEASLYDLLSAYARERSCWRDKAARPASRSRRPRGPAG